MNYYEVLGVSRTAGAQEIREKFRKLARENHPDRFPPDKKAEAEKRFQDITEALNVLTNEQKRRQHDAEIQKGGRSAATDPAQVAKAYVARGVKAFKEGDFIGARENFDMAVKHDAADSKSLHYLALACARIPSAARQAVQAIESAVKLEPMNPQYLKDAGLICRAAGLSAKAQRYLEEALQWDRENPDILNALAELRQGREGRDSGRGLFDSLFRKG